MLPLAKERLGKVPSNTGASLAGISSTQSSPYRYGRLKGTKIRLLQLLPPTQVHRGISKEIECKIIHVRLENAPKYEALSYVWGDQERKQKIRIRAGRRTILDRSHYSIPVTLSLFSALGSLRYASKTRVLWIDQICIDQDNTQEKNEQVPRMRHIYEMATCTIIWLGDSIQDSEILWEMYKTLSTPAPINDSHSVMLTLDQRILARMLGVGVETASNSRSSVEYRLLLERFLNLSWFSRAWVYQEAVVAEKVDMAWSRVVLPFDFVTGLIVNAYSIFKSEEDGKWHEKLKKTKGFGPLRAIFYDRLEHKKGRLDFLNVLWHARLHLDATDDRDRVYAFLAFHEPTSMKSPGATPQDSETTIKPSYSSLVQDVYTHFARRVVQSSQNLDILQFVVPTQKSDYELPSWVPNWAESRFVSGSPIVIPGVPNRFNACNAKSHVQNSTSSPTELHVLGHILGKVSAVIRHKFKHSYCSSSLKVAFGLDELDNLVQAQLAKSRKEASGTPVMPGWASAGTRETLLRTFLADGSFTPEHQITYPVKELLDAYDDEPTSQDSEVPERDASPKSRRQFLRQAGEIASGKRIFLSDHFDIGLGYSTMRKGDFLCILYGSKLPCVLRKNCGDGSRHDVYRFIGQCYLDGWMDGSKNPRDWRWWDLNPQAFIIV
ncbi:het-6OR heterokaryon incompatibility (het-6OR allele) [Fusarium mundagurra]|uniref:Het-6OR heterokaryon incompatibility (Het-6OR allele) n=1 Tax=Fusarium mundagurra TaxID=1567541 RepID=A0A8H5XVX5_9HYPO|nr:het-6OR heterokaryon incompatibility (het-6OR allele) [Fusarium mundagurra]